MTMEQNQECILSMLIVTLFQMKKKEVEKDEERGSKEATVVVPITSVEVTCSEAMLALSFHALWYSV